MKASSSVLVFAISIYTFCATVGNAQVAVPAWQQTGAPLKTWRSIACSADGARLIAIPWVSGPVYLSTDSGATWAPSSLSISADLYGGHEVASSADGQTLAVLGLETIYTSTDSGTTWTARQATSHQWSGIAMSADGAKMAAVSGGTSGGEIYTSSDTGADWTLRDSSQSWQDVASSADGTKWVAVSGDPAGDTSGYIYTSINSGTNWTQNAAAANDGYNYYWTSVACSADGTKLFATEINSFDPDLAGASSGQIHVSTDAGGHWDTSSFSLQSPLMLWVNVACSTNGNVVVAASAGFYSLSASYSGAPFAAVVYASTNSGSSWQLSYAPNMNWQGVASSADGTKLYAASFALNGSNPGPIYAYTAPSTNVPTLNIATGGGNAFVSWPWPSTGFVLQQNTNLASPNWITLSNAAAVVNQAIVPQTNANDFYRLVQP
ncbi:MAG TPA: hypothetical protein VGI03_03920 [Verrucomicrobiae bacterium]